MSLIFMPHVADFVDTWAIRGNGSQWEVIDEKCNLIARFDTAAEAYQFAHDVWVK